MVRYRHRKMVPPQALTLCGGLQLDSIFPRVTALLLDFHSGTRAIKWTYTWRGRDQSSLIAMRGTEEFPSSSKCVYNTGPKAASYKLSVEEFRYSRIYPLGVCSLNCR